MKRIKRLKEQTHSNCKSDLFLLVPSFFLPILFLLFFWQKLPTQSSGRDKRGRDFLSFSFRTLGSAVLACQHHPRRSSFWPENTSTHTPYPHRVIHFASAMVSRVALGPLHEPRRRQSSPHPSSRLELINYESVVPER